MLLLPSGVLTPSVDKQHVNGYAAEQAAAPESLSVSIFMEAGSGLREETLRFPEATARYCSYITTTSFPCFQSFVSTFSLLCVHVYAYEISRCLVL